MCLRFFFFGICFTVFSLSLAAQEDVETTPEATAILETDIYMPVNVDDIPEGYALVWNDEFSGAELDRSKWGFATGGTGFGNNEEQYYTNRPENTFLEDGNLVIQALEERYMGLQYSSAKLQTLILGEWQYARIDIRAKLPIGQGMWPAFWMLPARTSPLMGEIDIMEYLGHEPNLVYGTLHYRLEEFGEPRHVSSSYMLEEGTFADDFHIFSIVWDAESIRWYVDGIEYHSASDWHPEDTEIVSSFDRAYYLIINLAVGGTWPGSPDETTVFPQRLMVDYVRVYQTETSE